MTLAVGLHASAHRLIPILPHFPVVLTGIRGISLTGPGGSAHGVFLGPVVFRPDKTVASFP